MSNDGIRRLSRRDYLLLPLISLVTVVLFMGCGEILARVFWAERIEDSCAIENARIGQRYRPGCTSWTKVAEGPWVENRYNECGYRTLESCMRRERGELRVVVTGSSTSRGHLVAYEDSFAARASATLRRRCGRPVDFQNLGTGMGDVDKIDLRMPEALALKPDAIVMLLGPQDMLHMEDDGGAEAHTPAQGINLHDVAMLLRRSRLFRVGQFYLYKKPAFQITAFLRNGSYTSGYLSAGLTPGWRRRVGYVDSLLSRMAEQMQQAEVPLTLFYVPERPQAALEISKYARPDADPHALGKALQQVAASHGIDFVDLTPTFAQAADFGSLYYLADGHPRAEAHTIIAKAVVERILRVPAFANACGATGVVSKSGAF